MDYPLFDVFISYAHEDLEWAKWLYDGLSSHGFTVFLDDEVLQFGDNFPARIEESLEHSIAVLLLLSRQSRDSAWVKFESSFNWASTFIDGTRKLIPVIIEEGFEVPTRLRSLLSCEFKNASDREGQLQRLIKDLLSRRKLEIGPYRLDRARHPPEELVRSIVACTQRYMRPAQDRVLLFESTITELVDNAFRHTTSARVSLEVQATGTFGQVTVEDSGAGFDLRATLKQSLQLVDADPAMIGRRGLVLLEAQGVRLLNEHKKSGQHLMKSIVWWTPPIGKLGGDSSVRVRANGSVIVAPVGRIDHDKGEALQAALIATVYDPRTNGIVFDLSGVDYISSFGLRVLMTFAMVARINQYEIVVCNLTPIVSEIFAISRVDKAIKVAPTLAAAEAAVDASLKR